LWLLIHRRGLQQGLPRGRLDGLHARQDAGERARGRRDARDHLGLPHVRVHLSTDRLCSVPEGADPTKRYIYYESS
jgi:hypothetical protein